MNEFLNKVKIYVKKLVKKDQLHGFDHVLDVVRNCKYLAKFYPKTDLEILLIATYFHDTGRSKESLFDLVSTNHTIKSVRIASEFLRKISYEKPKVICEIIRESKWESRPNTIEGKILWDADKLEYLSPERCKTAIELLRKSKKGILIPFYFIEVKRRLLKLPSRFNLPETIELARKRYEEYRRFLLQEYNKKLPPYYDLLREK